jgi:hypothetical protein
MVLFTQESLLYAMGNLSRLLPMNQGNITKKITGKAAHRLLK